MLFVCFEVPKKTVELLYSLAIFNPMSLFEMHQVSGKGALERIMVFAPDEFTLLYIADVGRKKAELEANLLR